MNKRRTDNDGVGFSYKVSLRIESLPNKKTVNILDCYCGHGFIWEQVKRKANRDITITPIDSRSDKTKPYLKGHNVKFLKSMDLTKYDIIDLDAYGVPFEQLEVIFDKQYCGIVHVTFIQSGMGRLNNKMLNKIGYTNEMIKKSPTLFSKNGFNKFCKYLRMNGISNIFLLSLGRKNYLYFKIYQSNHE